MPRVSARLRTSNGFPSSSSSSICPEETTKSPSVSSPLWYRFSPLGSSTITNSSLKRSISSRLSPLKSGTSRRRVRRCCVCSFMVTFRQKAKRFAKTNRSIYSSRVSFFRLFRRDRLKTQLFFSFLKEDMDRSPGLQAALEQFDCQWAFHKLLQRAFKRARAQ